MKYFKKYCGICVALLPCFKHKEEFMGRRKWTSDQKFAIVLQGLRGDITVTELCREHNISQVQYYQWRDKFFKGAKHQF